ncbi:BZ3500_MvSof-1268-A1-R1_Chr12-2g03761 [Microbotryum saponariae]|uniref:BZ3500_MvSof-1268-A1-R1_Chr12-2g03753 protein n=1 Tax=Microbotryum saponariae TaxID=289078 RepID=A0A2X0KQ68_9BASI|nr:BZ3500_MvSof-1268-A1-R1_Chr12-2g03753 [Microbotryum saponariae]SCZ94218.1 BZ3500_MvSof-1268-A1-R1_Chr12-2g03761 [Microbotryum saponariae]
MTIAELHAFDVAPADASLRTELRVSRHRCSDQRTQEWISTFGRRVDKQYGALAQRSRHFGSLDGVVTTATPLEIGSLICFGLKRASPHEQACYSTHLIDGTMPFRMIDGRQVIDTCAHAEQRLPPFGACPGREMPPVESLQAAQLPPRIQRGQVQENGSPLDAWSHARHQPKPRAPQATFDRPPRARKRSERVFEDL